MTAPDLHTLEPIYRELAKHHPTRGMSVASGVTCQCGYWTGVEEPGKTRPVGVQGDQLDWHRVQVLIAALSVAGYGLVADAKREAQARAYDKGYTHGRHDEKYYPRFSGSPRPPKSRRNPYRKASNDDQ